MSRKTLCRTLLGNKCEYLTVSSAESSAKHKKGVIVMARVHPGETVSSWMMQGSLRTIIGLIEFLVDPNNKEAAILRNNFVFKIIPMLNPDGVVNGNYRCSMAGCDLNRQWDKPSKVGTPCNK